jgi:hypothetical protein
VAKRPPNAGKGRKAGVPNKLTKSAREAFQLAFVAVGGGTGLATWAKANPTEFYKLYARLIPVEHVGEGGTGPIATTVKHIYESAPPITSGRVSSL